MDTIAAEQREALVELLLSIADDKFILGARNSDWTGLGPMLEEDIAFSALAQDDIAHAKALYEFVAEMTGRNADQIAYGREPAEYRCAQLVEVEDEFDWAKAVVRQFFCDHHDELRSARLAASSLTPLAELAGRILIEQRLHLGHADSWVVRLGRGTEESRTRMQAAVAALAPHACMLLEPTSGVAALESAGVYPRPDYDMFERWSARVSAVLESAGLKATLRKPGGDSPGGRRGRHSPAFPALLAELTEVYRVEPGAAW